MPETTGNHSVLLFTSPQNGTSPIDADEVRVNDNTLREAYVTHDGDSGIHVQSSSISGRPAAGVTGRKWIDTDDYKLWYDTGATWVEVAATDITGLDVDYGQLINVPSTFTPATHTHDASDITTGLLLDAVVAASNITQHEASLSIGWSQLTSVPATFTPAAHTHAASEIVSGSFADARISQTSVTQHEAALTVGWAQLTSVPTTFTPASHTHAWSDITSGLPAFTTRWPTWAEVTSKPSSFTPSSHTHDYTTDLTNVPSTFTPSAHTHTASDITDFSEAVDDRVNGLLVAGSNITLTYDDVANTLTITSAGSGSVTNLEDLANVGGTPTDGQSLVWNNTAGRWEPQTVGTGGSGATVMTELGDVTFTSLATGEYLQYDGADWVNTTISLSDLDDLSVASPTDGHVLTYNSTGAQYELADPQGAYTPAAHTHVPGDIPSRLTGINVDNSVATQDDHFWSFQHADSLGEGTYPQDFVFLASLGGNLDAGLQLSASYGSDTGLWFRRGSNNAGAPNGANAYQPWEQVWTDASDGAGSGLDADLLDGQEASAFAAASHTHDYTTDLTNVPTTFTPEAHTHVWADITSGVPTFATRWPAWSEVTSKPTTFTPAAHTHAWSDITTGVPTFATRWPTWGEVTGKPSTFTPSSHTHDWADITTGVPAFATRWPSWTEVTSKPTTFTPSSHSHSASNITSGTFANARISQASVTQHESALSIAWSQVTGEPSTLSGYGVTSIDNIPIGATTPSTGSFTTLSTTSTGSFGGNVTVSGTVTATGFFESSSRDLKKNIGLLDDDPVDMLHTVDVVEFQYKGQEDDYVRIGIIADDSPEWITGPNGNTFDIANAVGLLIAANQQLANRVADLERRLNAID